MKRKVFIVNPNPQYVKMFRSAGWAMEREKLWAADLVQFTGGHDVTPSLYGEPAHPTTSNWPERDQREALVFKAASQIGLPMAGICRGGQFLNVMCGGALWQDVDNHAIAGTHQAWDVRTGHTFDVTSTHHQMMRVGPDGQLIVAARRSDRKTGMKPTGGEITVFSDKSLDVEAVFYPKHRAFCFQPHPEYDGHDDLAVLYMEYLDELLLNTTDKAQAEGGS